MSENSDKNLGNGFASQETIEALQALMLPPSLTIETVSDIAGVFKQIALMENAQFIFDVSQVERITTPGLQLLLSLKKTIVEKGGECLFVNHPRPFVEALQDTGLMGVL